MLINRQFGDYVLLRRLAVGGQSEVFLAVKQGPRDYNRPVVIKALPSNARDEERYLQLFYQEAYISSRFTHPNVINVHDAKVIDSDPCMFMDFVSGQTVADIAQRGYKRGTPPTLKQVVQIVADACAGLDYVHTFRDLDDRTYAVIHRDVSPQNLMVTYQGVTMLFDFGIAKVIGLEEQAFDSLTGGKYAYMSPEQLGGGEVDPRSDIFSLGIILYELTTGYRLFRRNTPPEVIDAVLEAPIQPPQLVKPGIPEFLDTVILKALQRDPDARYQSANAMRADLVHYLETHSDGEDLRRGLGEYVAGMFQAERGEIAQTLRQAPRLVDQSEPLGATHLEELGTERFGARPVRDPSLELEIDRDGMGWRAEPALDPTVTMERERPGPASVEEASSRERALQDELGRMRRRQTTLYVVIALVLAVAAVLLGAS